MSRIGFVSLGCPKNLLDTEVMLGHINEAGYEITPEQEEADIIVINTCAFIEDAKKESIDNILDIAWLKENGNLKGIIVTGCLAERYREEIMKEFTEVDCVLGTGSVHSIVKAIEEIEKGNKYQEYGDKNTVELGGDRIITTGDAYAYLKISEGCNNRCTYCSIPNIRGKFRSRPMDDIVKEAKELAEMGIKELIVIGQDTTAYGIDLYKKYELATLLNRLSKETDVKWLRILYCYPDKITPELINEFKTNEKLIKYIDIPIQHINDRILKKMNRYYDIRRHRKGSVGGATVIYAVFFLVYMIYQTSKGFIYQYVAIEDMDIGGIVAGFFLLLGLFIFCNWLVTSIQDGDGTLAQVYMIPAYGSLPLLVSMIAITVCSYGMTYNESFLLTILLLVGIVWSVIQIFLGFMTVHDYSAKENMLSILLTVVFMIIAAIMVLIIAIMWEELYEFLYTIAQEVLRNVFD